MNTLERLSRPSFQWSDRHCFTNVVGLSTLLRSLFSYHEEPIKRGEDEYGLEIEADHRQPKFWRGCKNRSGNQYRDCYQEPGVRFHCNLILEDDCNVGLHKIRLVLPSPGLAYRFFEISRSLEPAR